MEEKGFEYATNDHLSRKENQTIPDRESGYKRIRTSENQREVLILNESC